MNNRKATKRALLTSVMALALCVVMLVGTTFAWFTDTAKTSVNKIEAGNLKIELQYATEWNEDGSVKTWSDAKDQTLQFKTADGRTENIYWEPGCTYELPELRVVNKGNLALKFYVSVNGVDGDSELLDVIDWKMTSPLYDGLYFTDLDASVTKLMPGDNWPFNISAHMQKDAGNHYQGMTIEGIGITVVATQDTVEKDSKDDQYDKDATYPVINADELKSALAAGGIVTVGGDVDPAEAMVVSKKTTVNMEGNTIANTKDICDINIKQWSLISVQGNDADLTITGNGTFKAKENDCYAVDVRDGATVTIEDGTFIGNVHAVYVLKGTANIKGGFFSVQQKYTDAPGKENEFVLNCYDANRANGTARIIVTGGTFVNFNPADCYAEGAHTNFVADGYKVVSEKQANGDIWYTVIPE